MDLKEVVVPGGGQNDLWHNLSCKGKYAGEIRLEITYYDTRPQQEKPERLRQAASNSVEEGGRDSLKGPRQPKAPVKRRPLPSDPVSGAPASASVIVPDHVATPPRGYPPSPTVAPDHAPTPPRAYREPSAIPDHFQNQTPPRGYQSPAVSELPTPPRGYQSPAAPEHVSTPPRGYQNPPSAIPEHVHTPNRGYQSPSYIPNQSPLQSVEYNTPPPHFSPSQDYGGRSPTNGYGPPSGVIAASPASRPIVDERYEIYDSSARTDFTPGRDTNGYRQRGESFDTESQPRYNSRYERGPPDQYGSPPSPGGPPPPPPAHRTRNGSSQASPSSAMVSHGSYGFPSDSRSPNAYTTTSHEPHRHSIPAYSQSNSYQAYSPERDQNNFRRSDNGGYQESPPRHHSYDSAYGTNYGSMQPTVEDAPPSPGGGAYSQPRNPRSRTSSYDQRYDEVPSPAPLNLTNRGGSAASGRNSASSAPTPSHQYSSSSIGYTSATNSQVSYRDRSRDRSYTDASMSSRTSYNSMPRQEQRPRGQSEDPAGYSNYGMPPVPATLVAGIDPAIAQEISDRIYDEKRASGNNSSRGRPQYQNQNQNQYEHNGRKLLGYQEPVGDAFVPAAATYDDRQSRFSTATVAPIKPRPVSPDTRVARKSVSPAPRPSDDQRRLSGVPFGPDSYNALNPSVSGPAPPPSISAAYDPKAIDPDAKIITHDGREVDPSDHIPESNYAPLLEPKAPKYASQLPDRNYRPPPNNPPMSAGRRPLKQAGRPQSMSSMGPMYMTGAGSEPTTPAAGRNRLQKKVNRVSAQPAPHSSPLAPISPYQDNSYVPKSLPRANTMDFNSSENHTPPYQHIPSYRATPVAPPIPAKIPEGNPSYQGGGGDPWALLEEMKNIDLGTGRARRRGY